VHARNGCAEERGQKKNSCFHRGSPLLTKCAKMTAVAIRGCDSWGPKEEEEPSGGRVLRLIQIRSVRFYGNGANSSSQAIPNFHAGLRLTRG
jgi:hypothetical protein